jgi:hypothetical protein
VELDVIDLNTTVLLGRISILDKKFVINAKFALRHATELSLDKYLANDI